MLHSQSAILKQRQPVLITGSKQRMHLEPANWKTIMVIGEIGSGQSTTLNLLVVVLIQIYNDHLMIHSVNNSALSSQEQGKSVTSYHLDTIDAVFFVLESSQARLSPMQRYLFNEMLGLFGKDIQSNIFVLITFCDGADPPLYASLKTYGLPHKIAFKLNNLAFFAGFQNHLR